MRWLDKVYRKVSERFYAELAGKHGLKPEEIEMCRSIAAEDPAHSITISQVTGGVLKKEEISAS
jgi:hypothetical protein